MMCRVLFGSCVGFGVLLASGSALAAEVTLVDLGTLGGDEARAQVVSDAGYVAGYATETADGPTLAFRWTEDGGMEKLFDAEGNTRVNDLNDLGEAVGYTYIYDPDLEAASQPPYTVHNAFFWSADTGVVLLDHHALGGRSATAFYVNEAGQVAGTWTHAVTRDVHAFLWTPGDGVIDLGTLGGDDSYVRGLTEDGTVVGFADDADGNQHACIWPAGGSAQDLDTLGGSTSRSEAVNGLGQVAGWSTTADGATHAFLWTDGVGMVDLGSPGDMGAMADVVNDEGHVAGTTGYSSPSTSHHPFLWTPEGGAQDLGNPYGAVVWVENIDNQDGIVGLIPSPGGPITGFLWTPEEGYHYLLGATGDPAEWSRAEDGNNLGWIVGSSGDGAGGETALLWVVDLETTEDALDGAIEEVEDLVDTGTLNSGQGNALTSKLESALAALEKGHLTAACNKIEAFANQVEGLVSSGKLTATEGDALLDAVSDLEECAG